MENLINKIKENGYWKIIIRPTEFKEDRIKDKDSAVKIMEESKIVFRGWDYPHIDRHEGIFRSGPDSVSSYCDWPEGGHFEFWKFYLNGQFVHYFSMTEDYHMGQEEIEKAISYIPFLSPEQKINNFFSIINALYSITEVFYFAANLAKATDYGSEIEVSIEIGNTENRALFFWQQPYRHLSQAYICRYQPIKDSLIIKTEELISNTSELALDFTARILKEFNWKEINKNVLLGDQEKLVEKRL